MICNNKHFYTFGFIALSLYGVVWAIITKCNIYSNRNIDIALLLAGVILLVLFLILNYIAETQREARKKSHILILEVAAFATFALLYFAIFYKFDELLMILCSMAIAIHTLIYTSLEKKLKN